MTETCVERVTRHWESGDGIKLPDYLLDLAGRIDELETAVRNYREANDALQRSAIANRDGRWRAEEALRTLRQWDMLDACADGPWAKRLIDDVLAQVPPRVRS